MKLTFTCDQCGKVSSSDDEPLHDWVSLTIRNVLEPKRFHDFCSLDCLRKYYGIKDQAESHKDPVVERWWTGLVSLIVWVVLIIAIFWGFAKSEGRELTARWRPSPETDLTEYRLYRGIDLLAIVPASTTTAVIQADTGDELALTAWRGNVSSDPAFYVVLSPALQGLGVHRVSSEETVGEQAPASAAIDNDLSTFWHSKWAGNAALPPHYIALELPRPATVSAVRYHPRQDGSDNGHVVSWELESSMDGVTWEPWGKGAWLNDAYTKEARLPLREVLYIRLWGNEQFAAAAEIKVCGVYAPDPPAMVKLTMQQSTGLNQWQEIDHPLITAPKASKDFFRIKIEDYAPPPPPPPP